MSELLPCPHCGSGAIAGQTLDGVYYVMCVDDTCFGMVGYCETQDNAIENWNRRAPSPSPAPGVVTEEMVSAGHDGLEEYRRLYVSKTEVRAILTAALASLSQPAKGEREGGASIVDENGNTGWVIS